MELSDAGFEEIALGCIAVRVRILNRVVTAVYDDALRPFDITVGQLNLLVTVGRMGRARSGAIAAVLNMDQSTTSRNVRLLIERGLLSSEPDPSDGRVNIHALTIGARRLLLQSLPAWRSAQEIAKRLIGREGIERIDEAVKALQSSTQDF